MNVELGLAYQADRLQMFLDHLTDLVAELGDDRWHEFATWLPVTAARIEHRLQLIHEEGHISALPEDRGDDARERDDPLEVIEVLRVDEDLERAALLVFGALVQHDVV